MVGIIYGTNIFSHHFYIFTKPQKRIIRQSQSILTRRNMQRAIRLATHGRHAILNATPLCNERNNGVIFAQKLWILRLTRASNCRVWMLLGVEVSERSGFLCDGIFVRFFKEVLSQFYNIVKRN